jgi:hypothetical protein
MSAPLFAPLGELVAVAYDLAARHSKDPHEVSRLATQIVADIRGRSLAFDRARRAMPTPPGLTGATP